MTNTSKSIGTTGLYSTVVSATRAAIGNELTGVNKWKKAGSACREFYGSEVFMREVKAQFIADAILPELNKTHQEAMARELPRKGSADYVAFVGAHGVQAWEDANQAKKDARSTCDTMFSRVVSHAFPADKKESVATTTKTKLIELINDAIKKAQKDEAPDYDATTLIAQLQAALATASK
jgi:hypothetical protein